MLAFAVNAIAGNEYAAGKQPAIEVKLLKGDTPKAPFELSVSTPDNKEYLELNKSAFFEFDFSIIFTYFSEDTNSTVISFIPTKNHDPIIRRYQTKAGAFALESKYITADIFRSIKNDKNSIKDLKSAIVEVKFSNLYPADKDANFEASLTLNRDEFLAKADVWEKIDPSTIWDWAFVDWITGENSMAPHEGEKTPTQ